VYQVGNNKGNTINRGLIPGKGKNFIPFNTASNSVPVRSKSLLKGVPKDEEVRV
jgi:hypothetical protein